MYFNSWIVARSVIVCSRRDQQISKNPGGRVILRAIYKAQNEYGKECAHGISVIRISRL